MNANRLVDLVHRLSTDLSETNLVSQFSQLVTHTQQAINSPNESTQRQADTTLNQLVTSLRRAPSNQMSPGQREDLNELHVTDEGVLVSDLIGEGLADRLTRLFSVAPNIKTLDALREIQKELGALSTAVTELSAGLEGIGLEPDELEPGESVIGMTVPRDQLKDGVIGLRKEIAFFEQLAVFLAECETGKPVEPSVHALRSSGFGLDLGTSLAVAKGVAVIVGGVKTTLELMQKWRDLKRKAEEIGVDPKLADQLAEQGRQKMDEKIDEIEAEIFQQCAIDGEGRTNELKAGIRLKIKGVAARMERGFNFEVRTALPAAPDQKQKDMAVPITALSNMRFERIDGPPLLELPEADENGVEEAPKKTKAKKAKD